MKGTSVMPLLRRFRTPVLLVVAVVVLDVSACAWIDRVDPTLPPSSPTWVHCEDENGNDNGMVCPQGETCGGGKFSVGCPAGSCCDLGVAFKAPQTSAPEAGSP